MGKTNRKGAEKARRKKNADRQARIRERRDAAGQCRTCGEPAAVSDRTGKLAKQCRRHLKLDTERHAVIELPWFGRPARATGAMLNGGARLL